MYIMYGTYLHIRDLSKPQINNYATASILAADQHKQLRFSYFSFHLASFVLFKFIIVPLILDY